MNVNVFIQNVNVNVNPELWDSVSHPRFFCVHVFCALLLLTVCGRVCNAVFHCDRHPPRSARLTPYAREFIAKTDKKEHVLCDELRGKIGDTFSTPEAPQENPEPKEQKEEGAEEAGSGVVKGKKEMGCGSSSPSEVAEMDNTDAPAGGGGSASKLHAQTSLSSFDLSQLPKKTFTANVPKRVGRFDFFHFPGRNIPSRGGYSAHAFVTQQFRFGSSGRGGGMSN